MLTAWRRFVAYRRFDIPGVGDVQARGGVGESPVTVGECGFGGVCGGEQEVGQSGDAGAGDLKQAEATDVKNPTGELSRFGEVLRRSRRPNANEMFTERRFGPPDQTKLRKRGNTQKRVRITSTLGGRPMDGPTTFAVMFSVAPVSITARKSHSMPRRRLRVVSGRGVSGRPSTSLPGSDRNMGATAVAETSAPAVLVMKSSTSKRR